MSREKKQAKNRQLKSPAASGKATAAETATAFGTVTAELEKKFEDQTGIAVARTIIGRSGGVTITSRRRWRRCLHLDPPRLKGPQTLLCPEVGLRMVSSRKFIVSFLGREDFRLQLITLVQQKLVVAVIGNNWWENIKDRIRSLTTE